MAEIVLLIRLLTTLFIWIIIASVILSYILSPYHPIRVALDRILEPLLNPIRRIVPSAGMMDFSPVILILLVQFLSSLLIRIILRF